MTEPICRQCMKHTEGEHLQSFDRYTGERGQWEVVRAHLDCDEPSRTTGKFTFKVDPKDWRGVEGKIE